MLNDRVMSNKLLHDVFLITLGVFLLLIPFNDTSLSVLIRNRRQLLWPNSTVLQFNVGVGTPSPADKINVNWAFQANFQLPWNRSQIPFDILEANSGYTGNSRKKREVDINFDTVERDGDYTSGAKLHHFYKSVEYFLEGFGYNGTSCVLQTLCQLGAHPLHSHNEDDLLHELVCFILNPTNDLDSGVPAKDDNLHYIQAYKDGEIGRDCTKMYNSCTMSLIDMFSVLDT